MLHQSGMISLGEKQDLVYYIDFACKHDCCALFLTMHG